MMTCSSAQPEKVLSAFRTQNLFAELVCELPLERRLNNTRKRNFTGYLLRALLVEIKRTRDRYLPLFTLAIEQAFVEDAFDGFKVREWKCEILGKLGRVTGDGKHPFIQ